MWAMVALERSSSSRNLLFLFFWLFIFWFEIEIQTYFVLLRTAVYLQFSRPDPLYDPNIFHTHNSYRFNI